jgi:hypothetical protein
MKQNTNTMIKFIVPGEICAFTYTNAAAQRRATTISSNMINKVSEIVKPIKDKYGAFFKGIWSTWKVDENIYQAEFKTNITIPGTSPSDQNKLQVKISFDTKQESTAIALLGTSIATTFINTFNGKQELYEVYPVVWIASQTSSKTHSEESVIEKI